MCGAWGCRPRRRPTWRVRGPDGWLAGREPGSRGRLAAWVALGASRHSGVARGLGSGARISPPPAPALSRLHCAGLTFALAASPCSTPILATLLAYVSTTRDPVTGAHPLCCPLLASRGVLACCQLPASPRCSACQHHLAAAPRLCCLGACAPLPHPPLCSRPRVQPAGGALLFAYTLGYVGPLLAAALFTGALQRILSVRQWSAWVTPASGVLLLAGGTYGLLSRLVPA